MVSVKRLQTFLLYGEIEPNPLIKKRSPNSETQDDTAIAFKNVTVKWNPELEAEVLKQMTFKIKSGSLTAVIGQVGTGKTTLFHALLNEIPTTQGEIQTRGEISYCSQEAWIFASTIKQNILFGQPMNKERYEKVINVCQLKRDFQLLPYGENTIVGERGINLSGGQCARVNLARAVYHEADIYLLDDPLSAVDTHVGKGIFEDCIKAFLKDKTVILITHQFHYLKYVDKILVLKDGTLQTEGTYSELLNSELDLTKMMQSENEYDDDVPDNVEIPAQENVLSTESIITSQEEEEQSESRTLGNVSAKTYMQYFAAAKSGCLVFMVFVISIVCQISSSGADYFVTYWVNDEETGNFTVSDDDPLRGRSLYIYIYGSMTIFTVFITLAQAYTFFNMAMRISRNLHASMFNSIIHTTMAFFNANPIGRIMNRYFAYLFFECNVTSFLASKLIIRD